MLKLDLYWKTNRAWYHYSDDEEEPVPILNENAPKEAKESYANYLKQISNYKAS